MLPIGGVKQKLLAAHRAGITTVVIPQRNEPDLDDVPAEILEALEVHPVADVRQVLELSLIHGRRVADGTSKAGASRWRVPGGGPARR